MKANKSISSYKVQAGNLRECLAKKSISLSNSEALEIVAKMHGFKDWNTASASMQLEPSVFVINCYGSDDQEDLDLGGVFQYVVKAYDEDSAVEIYKEHMRMISGPTRSGFFPTQFWTENIVQIDLPVGQGVPLNMVVDYGPTTTLPYGQQKGVSLRRTEFDEDEEVPESKDEKDMELVLVLKDLQDDENYDDAP